MNSRDKGKRRERQIAADIRQHLGIDLRRTAQVDGGLSADLTGWTGVHVECKGPARFGGERYIVQAERDTNGDTPVVMVRADRCETIVMLRLADLPELVRRYLEMQT